MNSSGARAAATQSSLLARAAGQKARRADHETRRAGSLGRALALAAVVLPAMYAVLAAAPASPRAPAPAAAPAPAPAAAASRPAAWSEEVFTQPSKIIELAAAVGGIVKTVEADEGTPVKAGAVVLALDDALEEIAVRTAKLEAENNAEEQSARATMEQAQDEARIVKQLSSEGVEAELLMHQKALAADVARYKYEVAKKARQKAALDLEAAKAALERKKVRAPVAGLITRMPKEIGEAAQPLETVAQLAVTDTLHVLVHPPAQMLGALRVGQTLPLEILEPKPQTVTAKVEVVNEVVDAASNTFRVRLVIENADGRIGAGVRARVSVAGPEGLRSP
jgi:RND family efflux transporter MFP subunit